MKGEGLRDVRKNSVEVAADVNLQFTFTQSRRRPTDLLGEFEPGTEILPTLPRALCIGAAIENGVAMPMADADKVALSSQDFPLNQLAVERRSSSRTYSSYLLTYSYLIAKNRPGPLRELPIHPPSIGPISQWTRASASEGVDGEHGRLSPE